MTATEGNRLQRYVAQRRQAIWRPSDHRRAQRSSLYLGIIFLIVAIPPFIDNPRHLSPWMTLSVGVMLLGNYLVELLPPQRQHLAAALRLTFDIIGHCMLIAVPLALVQYLSRFWH